MGDSEVTAYDPHKTLSWGEFKRAVEAGGVEDWMEIFFIDVHMPTRMRVEVVPARPDNDGVIVSTSF